MTGGLSLLIGIALLWWALWLRRKAGRTLHWPRTVATVVASSIEESQQKDPRGHWMQRYVPSLRYRFEVEGRACEGELISLVTAVHSDRDAAEQQRARYEVGTTTSVAYNPENPAECVLETGGRGILTVVVVGLAFVALDLLPLGVMLASEDGREELGALWRWAMSGFPEVMP